MNCPFCLQSGEKDHFETIHQIEFTIFNQNIDILVENAKNYPDTRLHNYLNIVKKFASDLNNYSQLYQIKKFSLAIIMAQECIVNSLCSKLAIQIDNTKKLDQKLKEILTIVPHCLVANYLLDIKQTIDANILNNKFDLATMDTIIITLKLVLQELDFTEKQEPDSTEKQEPDCNFENEKKRKHECDKEKVKIEKKRRLDSSQELVNPEKNNQETNILEIRESDSHQQKQQGENQHKNDHLIDQEVNTQAVDNLQMSPPFIMRSNDNKSCHKPDEGIISIHKQLNRKSSRIFPTTNYNINTPGDIYKTKLCAHYTNGICYRGNKCHFAHGLEDLHYRVCKYAYENKICPRKDCYYLHEI